MREFSRWSAEDGELWLTAEVVLSIPNDRQSKEHPNNSPKISS